MNISLNVRARRWPGFRTRLVLVLIVVLVVARYYPWACVPLMLGLWAGGWLAPAPQRQEA